MEEETGSITINYSGWATDSESILSILEAKGYYRLLPIEEQEHPIETALSKVGTFMGKAICRSFRRKSL